MWNMAPCPTLKLSLLHFQHSLINWGFLSGLLCGLSKRFHTPSGLHIYLLQHRVTKLSTVFMSILCGWAVHLLIKQYAELKNAAIVSSCIECCLLISLNLLSFNCWYILTNNIMMWTKLTPEQKHFLNHICVQATAWGHVLIPVGHLSEKLLIKSHSVTSLHSSSD